MNFTGSLSLVLPQKDLWPFKGVARHWGNGNNQTFRGLLATGSEVTLIPGQGPDPKLHCDPPVEEGAYGDEVINEVVAEVRLTVDPQTDPVVFPQNV